MGCCTVKTKKILVFGFGGALLVIGLFIGGFMNMIVDSVVLSQLILSVGSTTYNNWIELPIPMYMEFHIFNVTNSDEYKKNQSIKPILEEFGPYVYREYHTRNIIGWNEENSTVTFQNIRTWQFDVENSVGSEHDVFTTINAVAATVNYMSRYMGVVEKVFMSSLLRVTEEEMFVTKSVRELMYEGYYDKLLNFTSQLNTSLAIPFNTFGYFVDRNGSETYDGVFNMYTGADEIERLGTVARWNYKADSPYYSAPCSAIVGTTGELWGPIPNTNDISVFSPDVCSPLRLSYSGEAEIYGLDGYGYTLNETVFDTSDPSEHCFCLEGTECVPQGLRNVSACRYSAPVFVSRPHFLGADSSLLDAVEGLKPDPEKHNFTFGLDPIMGVPLYANARMMLSVLIEPVKHVLLFENVPERIYFPVFWFNQKAVLSEDLASLAKLVRIAPDIGMGVFFGLAGIGALLLFIGIMLTVRHGWRGSEGGKLID